MFCRCRRNPDDDGRLLDRQLKQNWHDPHLRQRMLYAKLRAGRLSVDNALFRLAGFLGDLDVRSFMSQNNIDFQLRDADGNIFEELIGRLLEGTEHYSKDNRIATIAGISALILLSIEIQKTISPPDPLLGEWEPTANYTYTDEELRHTPIFQRIFELSGLSDDQVMPIVRTAIAAMRLHKEHQTYLAHFSQTMQLPPPLPGSTHTYTEALVRSIKVASQRRIGWQGHLTTAAGRASQGRPNMRTMAHHAFYHALEPFISDGLYSWDALLPANGTLHPHLRKAFET